MRSMDDASLGPVEAHRDVHGPTDSEREGALRCFRLLRLAIEGAAPLARVAKGSE
jgi:hypothetical protein